MAVTYEGITSAEYQFSGDTLHNISNPFQKWRFKTFIYKQKTFEKILKSMTMKQTWMENKQVIAGFGNWSSPRESIIREHWRGWVKEVKDKFVVWGGGFWWFFNIQVMLPLSLWNGKGEEQWKGNQ